MLELLMLPDEKQFEEITKKAGDAEDLIRHSRIDMQNTAKYKFYARMSISLNLVPACIWLPTAATDGVNYYYNPEFILGMSDERKATIKDRLDQFDQAGILAAAKTPDGQSVTAGYLLDKIFKMYRPKSRSEIEFLTYHEVSHVILKHMARCGDRDPSLFNKAADHSINTSGVKHIYDGDYNKALESNPFLEDACCDMGYLDWTTEDIYDDLLEQQEQNKGSGDQTLDHHMGEGSGSQDDIKDLINKILGIDPSKQPTMTKEEEVQAETTSKNFIKDAARYAGNSTPESIRELVKSFDEAKIDYKELLRKTLTSLLPSKDRCYSRLHKRSLAMTQLCKKQGMIYPNQRIVLAGNVPEEMIDVVLAIDTSGSITDEDIRLVFSEIVGITKQFPQFKLRVFFWDSQAYDINTYDHNNFNEFNNIEIKGGGGTEINSAFSKIETDVPDAKSVIIFTDLCILPVEDKYKDMYENDTVWIVNGNPDKKAPFGTTIDYDKFKE